MTRFRVATTAIGAAVLAVALTAGCAAGKQAQTAYEHPSVDAARGAVGDIQLESVALHAPSGSSWAKGESVPLTIYIANTGESADTLTKISSPTFPGGYSVTSSGGAGSSESAAPSASSSGSSGGGQQIAAGTAVGFGLQNLGTGTGSSPQSIELKNLSKKLFPGMGVKITFTFAKAGQTTLTVPVQVTAEPNDQILPSGSASAAE